MLNKIYKSFTKALLLCEIFSATVIFKLKNKNSLNPFIKYAINMKFKDNVLQKGDHYFEIYGHYLKKFL